MSYRTWHHYGYGLCTTGLKIDSVERIEQLLACAPEFAKKVHEYLEWNDMSVPTVEDYLEYDDEYCLGIATILREVIYEATGIEFEAVDDFDGKDYLIYTPTYPWWMPEKDKELTQEKVAAIFVKYVSIVTDTDIVLDYQEIANGG